MARVLFVIDPDLCDGCGVCVPACSQSALRLEGGKARVVDSAACDGLERCVGACPRGALRALARAPAGDAGGPEGLPEAPRSM